MRIYTLAAIAAVSLVALPAQADTIPLTISETNNDVSFYTRSLTFALPSNATNVLLTTFNAAADDIVSISLNGATPFLFTGINTGNGNIGNFTADGTNFSLVTATFNGAQTAVVNSGFLLGATNTLSFIINNNNIGISPNAQLTQGPSNFSFDGAVTFAVVPEPMSWAMMIGGFGAVGVSLRRRRRVTVRFA